MTHSDCKMPRCFIAIDIPENIREQIHAIQKELWSKDLFRGKITEKENIHLTLKFLGEIPEETLDEVKKKLNKVEFKPFEATIDGLGTFSPKQLRIIWMKMVNAEVFELQKWVDDSLSDLFPREQRFMGHITIARIKEAKDKDALMNWIQKKQVPAMIFPVQNFTLKQAKLLAEGPVYTNLKTYS
ncbi:MAG: RNA 2',3'-cyclic phosphodiesterase [Candidatus Woesearchaeota archaeon]